MKVTFLGTNGWYDTHTGNTISILIETQEEQIILDAGNGIYKMESYCPAGKPAFLFLSHFHLDHIVGLHILNKLRFNKGLFICGQPGTRDIIRSFVNFPFSMPLDMLPYRTEILELPGDEERLPFKVEFLAMRHSSYTLGYRFGVNGKTVAYCPDTGYCENAVKLAKDADLLITECAYRPGQTSEGWPHLNPETAARIAVESGAGRLALVHFDANLYRTLEDRKEAEETARRTFPNTVAALDGMELVI